MTGPTYATPSVTDGLVLWLDAQSLKGYKDGDKVSSRQNLVNGTQIFSTSNPSNQPTYQKRAINNQPALSFNGNDFLQYDGGMFNAQENWTVLILGYTEISTPFDSFFASDAISFDTNRTRFRQIAGSVSSAAHTIQTGAILRSYTKSGTTLIMDHNNEFTRTNDLTDIITGDTTTRIGRNGMTAANDYLVGRIGEIVVYDRALTDTELDQVYQSMQSKWLEIPLIYGSNNLKLWLDGKQDIYSDTACSIKANTNDTVGCWIDRSPNNNHAIQTNISERPQYIDKIVFDGINDRMPFNEINDIRSLFIVYNSTSSIQPNQAPLLGHPTSYNFHGTPLERNVVFRTNPDDMQGLLTSNLWYNSVPTPLDQIIYDTNLSILSIASSINLITSRLTKDRGFTDRNRAGGYAELIIHNQPLTDTQRRGIEKYLSDKRGVARSGCPYYYFNKQNYSNNTLCRKKANNIIKHNNSPIEPTNINNNETIQIQTEYYNLTTQSQSGQSIDHLGIRPLTGSVAGQATGSMTIHATVRDSEGLTNYLTRE